MTMKSFDEQSMELFQSSDLLKIIPSFFQINFTVLERNSNLKSNLIILTLANSSNVFG